MPVRRRTFIGATAALIGSAASHRSFAQQPFRLSEEKLSEIAAKPIHRIDNLAKPVVIDSLELLKNGLTYVSRVRTTDGAEGLAVANEARLSELYPVFVRRIAPFFVGKDARRLETLLVELYRHASSYKLQGIGLWAPQAAAEMAILDLHYFGGYLRTIRVARMANASGMPCTVHMSGSGLGYVDVCHLASCIDDPGRHQEFKGESKIPVACDTSSLRCENGVVQVPNGPGYGVTIDPSFIKEAKVVTVA